MPRWREKSVSALTLITILVSSHKSFFPVEYAGDEMYFDALLRIGRTVDPGVIERGAHGFAAPLIRIVQRLFWPLWLPGLPPKAGCTQVLRRNVDLPSVVSMAILAGMGTARKVFPRFLAGIRPIASRPRFI